MKELSTWWYVFFSAQSRQAFLKFLKTLEFFTFLSTKNYQKLSFSGGFFEFLKGFAHFLILRTTAAIKHFCILT